MKAPLAEPIKRKVGRPRLTDEQRVARGQLITAKTNAKKFTPSERDTIESALTVMALLHYGLTLYGRVRQMKPDERDTLVDKMRAMVKETRPKA